MHPAWSQHSEEAQLNMLIYSMGDQADDAFSNLSSSMLTKANTRNHTTQLKKKFDEHFCIYELAFTQVQQQAVDSVSL